MNTVDTKPKVLKESKNKIKVDFERTSKWTRFKVKYFNVSFLATTIYRLFRFILLLGVAYVILFPFFSKISGSFMGQEDFVDVTVKLVPKHWTLEQYKYIILENDFFKAFFNTFTLSLMCAVLQTFVCCLIAYGFAKFKFKGNKVLFLLVIFTMVVPHITLRWAMFMNFNKFDVFWIKHIIDGFINVGEGDAGFVANFMEGFNKSKGFVNLLNSNWPLTILSITGLAYKNGLYIFLLRQFFKGVPDELEESAYIDGSGVLRTFFTIIIPLSSTMLLTVFIFAFAWQWTDNFYSELLYVEGGPVLMPDIVKVPKSLQTDFAAKDKYNMTVKNTASLLIMIPLIVVYLFFQRSLVQGIERSGITG